MNINDKIKESKQKIERLEELIQFELGTLGREIEKEFEENGIESFGKLIYPEYYGLASISIGDSNYYYIPESERFDYKGDVNDRGMWISSSETC